MHAAVVELDALPDTVRAAAQDHDLRPIRSDGFVFVFVSRIVVRSIRFELGGARIDGFVNHLNIQFFSEGPDGPFTGFPQVGKLPVAEAVSFGLEQVDTANTGPQVFESVLFFAHGDYRTRSDS